MYCVNTAATNRYTFAVGYQVVKVASMAYISRHPTHSQLTTASYATSSYSTHPFAHLVVECEQVTGHRIQSGLVPAIQKSRLRLLGRSTRSGCGECIYLAPRWSLKWQSRSGPALVGRDVEHESMGTRHDNRADGSTG
ncbi:hypothetical protein BASA60_002272 [Batrachochytrium salamandrivorans]|nr:hypothetical protein BASA60_002272 [Batrachochytrium salamandrivorans]